MTGLGAERGQSWLSLETGILNGTGPQTYGPNLKARSIQITRAITKEIQ